MEATGGRLLSGNRLQRFSGVSIDSRSIAVEDVFVAITGTVHDGHVFVPDIIDRGVRGLIISSDKAAKMPLDAWQTAGIVCVAVEDTTRALGDLGLYNRRRSGVSVVAITGSSGKTTTRRMTTAVLSRQHDTLTAAGNFNNEIGVPLTLLNLSAGHRWAVLELGTNHPGEIARLVKICAPDIGVLTNIGPAHLQGLGSIEGVMHEKADLIRGLNPNGKAILNADDPRVMQVAGETQAEVILYGISKDARVRAEDIQETGGAISFRLLCGDQSVLVRLNAAGRFMVPNALAAAAVGCLAGLTGESVKAGLEVFTPAPGRMNIKHLANDIHLIDDAYNANPDSMGAALASLDALRAGGRSILVMGDMLELGPEAQSLHGGVGALAVRSGANRIYACGEFAAVVTAAARSEGLPAAATFTGTQEEIVADLKDRLRPGDWVLVKGSRGMAMDKVVAELEKWSGAAESQK